MGAEQSAEDAANAQKQQDAKNAQKQKHPGGSKPSTKPVGTQNRSQGKLRRGTTRRQNAKGGQRGNNRSRFGRGAPRGAQNRRQTIGIRGRPPTTAALGANAPVKPVGISPPGNRMVQLNPAPGNTIVTVANRLRIVRNCVVYHHEAHSYVVNTAYTRPLLNGTTSVEQPIAGDFSPSVAENIPLNVYPITFAETRVTANIAREITRLLTPNGLLNARQLEQTIGIKFGSQPWQVQIIRAMSAEVATNLLYSDNTAIYAKLLSAALSLRQGADYGIAMQFAAHNPDANMFTWINTTDQAQFTLGLINELHNGRPYVFFDGQMFNAHDLAIYRLIGHIGHMFTPVIGQRKLTSHAHTWPGIRLIVLSPFPVPLAWPDITAASLWAFAEKMAHMFGEQDFLVNGYWFAIETVLGRTIPYVDCLREDDLANNRAPNIDNDPRNPLPEIDIQPPVEPQRPARGNMLEANVPAARPRVNGRDNAQAWYDYWHAMAAYRIALAEYNAQMRAARERHRHAMAGAGVYAWDPNRRYVVDAYNQTRMSPLPSPGMPNWLYSTVDALHKGSNMIADYQMLTTLNVNERQSVGVVLYALLEIMFETLLYSWQITGLEMHQWLLGSAALPARARVLFAQHLMVSDMEQINSNARVFEQALSLIAATTASTPNLFVMWRRAYNIAPGADPNLHVALSPWTRWENRCKAFTDWPCIGNWLVTFPVDWGWSMVRPTGNVSLCIQRGAFAPDARAFLPNFLTGFLDVLKSPLPNRLYHDVLYVINLLIQGWLAIANVQVGHYYQTHQQVLTLAWVALNEAQYRFPDMVVDEVLDLVMPGTIMTYDFQRERVICPVFGAGGDEDIAALMGQIEAWKSPERLNTGVALARKPLSQPALALAIPQFVGAGRPYPENVRNPTGPNYVDASARFNRALTAGTSSQRPSGTASQVRGRPASRLPRRGGQYRPRGRGGQRSGPQRNNANVRKPAFVSSQVKQSIAAQKSRQATAGTDGPPGGMYLNNLMVQRFVDILDNESDGYLFQLPEVAPTVNAFYSMAQLYWDDQEGDFHSTFYDNFFVLEADHAHIEEIDFGINDYGEDMYDPYDAYDPRNAFDGDNSFDDYDHDNEDYDQEDHDGSDDGADAHDIEVDEAERPPNPRPNPGPHRRQDEEDLAANIAQDLDEDDYVDRYAGLYS